MTRVIGLSGLAGSGKTTAAEHLVERYGAKRYSFAAPLKEIVRRAFDLSHEQVYGTQAQKEADDPRYNVSPRWLMQRIATEGVREVLGEDFWVAMLYVKVELEAHPLVVIDDVRMVNEGESVTNRAMHQMLMGQAYETNGLLWALERADGSSVSVANPGHKSEAETKKLDPHLLIRASSPDDLRAQIDAAARAAGLQEIS